MAGRGEYACAYARASSIRGRSYVGAHARALTVHRTVAELAANLFHGTLPDLPEKPLVAAVQRAAAAAAFADLLTVLGVFRDPPPILVHLLRSFEYAALKAMTAAIARGEKPHEIPRLGRFAELHASRAPDIRDMTAGTAHAWMPARPGPDDLVMIETRLDAQYYERLRVLTRALRGTAGLALREIIAAEIRLRNAVWALRMRMTYDWDVETARPFLVGCGEGLAVCALEAFSFPTDDRQAWNGWRFERFLASSHEGPWKPEPLEFERNASNYLYRAALFSFRRYPLTDVPLYCLFRLKEFETDIITTVVEAVRLGMSERDIVSFLEGAA